MTDRDRGPKPRTYPPAVGRRPALRPLARPSRAQGVQLRSPEAEEARRVWPVSAPLHVKRVRLGVFACVDQRTLAPKAWELFYAWKEAPSSHPGVTEHFAEELARLIREALPVLPHDALVTVPPQGKSAHTGGEYAAGFLGRAVAHRLDRDFATLFAPQRGKTRHGRFASLERREAFELVHPDLELELSGRLVVVVDDLITSGRTLQRCLKALAEAGAVAFGFAYMSWG